MCPARPKKPSNTPTKVKTSFTLEELLKKINDLIPKIDKMLDDLGSGRGPWEGVRRNLKMLGTQISECDPDFEISDSNLVDKFNNNFEMDKLLDLNIIDFSKELFLSNPTSPKSQQVTFSTPSISTPVHTGFERKSDLGKGPGGRGSDKRPYTVQDEPGKSPNGKPKKINGKK